MLSELLDLRPEDIPAETIERATWMIADTLFAACYGFASPELSAYLENVAFAERDELHAVPVFGTGLYTTSAQAAMLYGTAIVTNELDEGNQFAKGHPAAHMLAPALITALEHKASGAELIRAFAIGYEVAARLAYASNMNDDMHPHGTWGIVGGAVASGLLQKKSRQQIIEAALLAASLPLATSWEAAVTGMTVRNLYAGIGSFLALQAWEFQAAGFASSEHVVDHLWGTILSKGIRYELFQTDLWAPPLLNKNYFKLYPSCRFSHSAIDALLALQQEMELQAAQIDFVQVETYGLAARLDDPDPANALAAKFSIPFLLSVLIHGHSLYDCFSGALFQDRSVRELAKNTRDGKCGNDGAAASQACGESDGCDARRHNEKRLRRCGIGGFDQPFPTELLRDKFTSMLGRWKADVSSKMIAEALLLPERTSVGEWLERIESWSVEG